MALTKFAILDRGYTGHEHLQGVNLIHMNGRLYDPMLHRFLMPDNFVQDPYNTLSFNRYSYVMNNPLMYTDANGEFFWFAVIAGAVIGAVTQAVKPGANFGTIVGGGLIGAAAGMVSAGVGSVVAGGSFFGSSVASTMGFWGGAASGAAGGFSGGFVGGTGMAWLNGANFGDGLGSGFISGVIGGIVGGMVNGFISEGRSQRMMRPYKSVMKDYGLTAQDPLPVSDEFLRKAQEVWFPDAPMDKVTAFSVENLSDNAKNFFLNNPDSAGITYALYDNAKIATGLSEVFFNSNVALSSAKALYSSMGHELVHVSQIGALAGKSAAFVNSLRHTMEFHAYGYQSRMGVGTVGNSFDLNSVQKMMQQYNGTWFNTLNSIKFPWTFNTQFINPF